MATTQTGEPVVDLTTRPTTAVTLCGRVAHVDVAGGVRVDLGGGFVCQFPPDFLPVVKYLSVLREEAVVREALSQAGAPDDIVDTFLDDGRLVRVATDHDGHRLDFSDKVRLVPTSTIWDDPDPESPGGWVTPDHARNDAIHSVGHLLVEAIWAEDDDTVDVVESLLRAAEVTGEPPEVAARSLACELPTLLADGYLHFGHVRPKAKAGAWRW